MKKIKKLSLSGLEKESIVLSVQEQMNIYAGSGIDGLCYFEGLEILSGMFGGNQSESYFINNYASTHGGYSSIFVTDPSTGTITNQFKGVDASSAIAYLGTQFYTTAASVGNYQTLLSSGDKILATMNEANGEVHAIVIKGYDATTGKYIYDDAYGKDQEVSTTNLNSAVSMAITGSPH